MRHALRCEILIIPVGARDQIKMGVSPPLAEQQQPPTPLPSPKAVGRSWINSRFLALPLVVLLFAGALWALHRELGSANISDVMAELARAPLGCGFAGLGRYPSQLSAAEPL